MLKKKTGKLFQLVCILLLASCMTSCALLLGGPLTSCQTAKPLSGKREIRKGYLIADIVLLPFITLPVDFKTGALYKPCHLAGKKKSKKK
jgi:hypothetical protein